MEKKRGCWALAGMLLGTFVLLAAGYVGAYCMTVQHPIWTLGEAKYSVPAGWQSGARLFFWPIHTVDRKLRPEYWRGWGFDEPQREFRIQKY
jgi:hypothetical protein